MEILKTKRVRMKEVTLLVQMVNDKQPDVALKNGSSVPPVIGEDFGIPLGNEQNNCITFDH